DAADEKPARAANTFTTVRIKCDRILTLHDQRFVDDVEHLEKRHVRRHIVGDVIDKTTGLIRTWLSPHFEFDAHLPASSIQLAASSSHARYQSGKLEAGSWKLTCSSVELASRTRTSVVPCAASEVCP